MVISRLSLTADVRQSTRFHINRHKPSFDGYAFHTFGSSIIVNKLIVEKIQIYYKIRIYTETVGKLVKFQWKNMGTYEALKQRYRLGSNIKYKIFHSGVGTINEFNSN